MAPWRTCEQVLRTVGNSGWGVVKSLGVEKLKAIMKVWSWSTQGGFGWVVPCGVGAGHGAAKRVLLYHELLGRWGGLQFCFDKQNLYNFH